MNYEDIEIGMWVRFESYTRVGSEFGRVTHKSASSLIRPFVDVAVGGGEIPLFLYITAIEPCPEMNGSLMKVLRETS